MLAYSVPLSHCLLIISYISEWGGEACVKENENMVVAKTQAFFLQIVGLTGIWPLLTAGKKLYNSARRSEKRDQSHYQAFFEHNCDLFYEVRFYDFSCSLGSSTSVFLSRYFTFFKSYREIGPFSFRKILEALNFNQAFLCPKRKAVACTAPVFALIFVVT